MTTKTLKLIYLQSGLLGPPHSVKREQPQKFHCIFNSDRIPISITQSPCRQHLITDYRLAAMSCGSPEFSNCSFEKCNLLNHFKSEKETSLRHWWSYNIAFDIIYLTESFARFCHFVKSQRTIYNNQRSAIHHKFGSILERLKNNDSVF